MKKFKDYIYIDRDRVNVYSSQVSELTISELSNSNEEISQIDASASALFAKMKGLTTSRQTHNFSINLNPVERFAAWCENTDNAVHYKGEELNDSDENSILVVEGKIEIPEINEIIETIELLKTNSYLEKFIPLRDDENYLLNNLKNIGNIPVLLMPEGK